MEARRRMVGRADQVSVLEAASNLRDLIRQDDRRGDALAGLTLAAVLGCEEIRAPTRTLLDIIKDEESGAAYRGLAIPQRQKSWKSFKDRLRLRRAGAAWSTSSSNPVSGSDLAFEDCNIQISDPIPVPPAFRIPQLSDLIPAVSSSRESEPIRPMVNTQPSPITPIGPVVDSSDTQNEIVELTDSRNAESVNIIAPPAPIRLAAALEAEREQQQRQREQEQRLVRAIQEQEAAAANSVTISDVIEDIESPMATEAAPAAPMRMSLMALLEETDREAGVRYMIDEDEDEDDVGGDEIRDEDEQEVEQGESGGVEYVCCVCMVRHKGAAFIPCGHTFCRLCSRELWVSRGNCPLCNGYILEILDIF